MSLINNMLKGLESRRSDEQEDVYDPVLGELSAVEYEELTARRSGNSAGLWTVLVLMILALVLYFSGTPGRLKTVPEPQTVQTEKKAGETPAEVLPGDIVSAARESTVTQPAYTTDSSKADFPLKLDSVLKAPAEDTLPVVKAGSRPVSLDDIRIVQEGNTLKLNVLMPVKVKYLMYTLRKPNRVVLELSNATYGGALPDINTLEGISAIRQRIEEDGTYKLVLESNREILIDRTELEDVDRGYTLHVNMAGAPEETSGIVASAPDNPESGMPGTFNKAPARKTDYIEREGITKTASRADTLVYEGRELYGNGKVREGIEKIIEAVKLEPEHISARTNLAVLLLEQDKQAAARRVLVDGLHIKPDQPEWARILARILYNSGELEQAKTVLEEAAPPINTNLEYHTLYAGILQALNEHTRAAIVYRNLLKYGGDNGSWWLGLGISLEAMARNSDAIIAYRNALNTPEIKPDSARFIKDRLQNLNQKS